jgi:hypothetical protein
VFKCSKCTRTTEPGEKQFRLVVEKRSRVYPPASRHHKQGKGAEAVREVDVCKACFSISSYGNSPISPHSQPISI